MLMFEKQSLPSFASYRLFISTSSRMIAIPANKFPTEGKKKWQQSL